MVFWDGESSTRQKIINHCRTRIIEQSEDHQGRKRGSWFLSLTRGTPYYSTPRSPADYFIFFLQSSEVQWQRIADFVPSKRCTDTAHALCDRELILLN